MGSGDTLKPWGWRPMGGLEHHFCPDFAPEPTGMPEPNFSFFFLGGAFSSGLLNGLHSSLFFLLSLGLVSSRGISPFRSALAYSDLGVAWA